MPAGVPTSWSVVALYRKAYGVALFAARGWKEQSDIAQAIIEIEDGVIRRSELLWKHEYGRIQSTDREEIILQTGSEYHLDKDIEKLVARHMAEQLREVGYLIPREEWEQRFPASALISKRWAEWHEACDAVGAKNLAWKPRWSMMMPTPEDWQPSFILTEDRLGVKPADATAVDPTGGYRWDDVRTAENAMRHMNSEWSFEETLILLQEEPVEQDQPAMRL